MGKDEDRGNGVSEFLNNLDKDYSKIVRVCILDRSRNSANYVIKIV